MKYISKILRQSIVLLLCFFAIISSAQNPFIQNKGQFPKQVKAKVNLPSGSLFIEGGKLIDENTTAKIENTLITSVDVRSALTCETKRGICASC